MVSYCFAWDCVVSSTTPRNNQQCSDEHGQRWSSQAEEWRLYIPAIVLSTIGNRCPLARSQGTLCRHRRAGIIKTTRRRTPSFISHNVLVTEVDQGSFFHDSTGQGFEACAPNCKALVPSSLEAPSLPGVMAPLGTWEDLGC